MSDQFKDLAIVLDGDDTTIDSVHAGIGLQLSAHYGAQLTVLEQGDDPVERVLRVESEDEGPFAGVQISGITDQSVPGQHQTHRPLEVLLRITRQSGRWIPRPEVNDLFEYLRSADLIVLGAPPDSDVRPKPDFTDVITEAGRPILVVPNRFAKRRPIDRQIGHRVLLAWNADAECARAVHDALPFLRRAEEVTILFVDKDRKYNAAQHLTVALSEHLARHGVPTRPEVLLTRDIPPSQLILDRLAETDGDLLVMGAFGRSPLREAWFGGVSAELLNEIAIPVLTSH